MDCDGASFDSHTGSSELINSERSARDDGKKSQSSPDAR